MRKLIALAISVAVVGTMALPATAGPGVDKVDVVEHYELDGSASGDVLGQSKLIRRADRLKANVGLSGLIPGGVYTFWWVVTPAGGTAPFDSFVASGAGTIVGDNGKTTIVMRAEAGQPSIEGFLLAFRALDFDLMTATVRVEIAYHGQAEDAGSELGAWLYDFWTGAACPQAFGLNPGGLPGDVNDQGLPHCPVLIAAQHDG